MDALEQKVSNHYTSAGGSHFDRIVAALAALGIDPGQATPADLKPVDEFHTGGMAATESLLDQLAIDASTRVLDIGSGLGGTARAIAERHGVAVTGVDLTPEFVETARRLSAMVGLGGRTRFEVGSGTAIPAEAASHDLALLLHVGMNIADKGALFAEVRRVLAGGGIFAVYDVMQAGADGQFLFPVPWSAAAETSFVAPPEAYREAAAAAGFALVAERDRRDFTLDYFAGVFAAMEKSGGPPPLGIHLLMGETAGVKLQNYVRMVEAGQIAPVEMIFRAPA